MDGIKVSFTSDMLDFVVDKAIEFKLGARGLRSIVETIMMDAMFTMPSGKKKTLVVDKAYAEAHLNIDDLLQDQ